MARARSLSNLYALLGETGAKASRYTVFMAMMKFASANSLAHMLSGQFDKLEAWVEEWDCSPTQVVDLYWEVTQALLAEGGQEAEATALLHKVLKAAEGGDAATLSAVSEQAKMACTTAIKDSETYKLDELLDFAAVQQLESSEPLVVALLRIFVEGKLADYTKFVSANGSLLDELGLDAAACEDKMRLLTLASLANEHEEVPYSAVASDLGMATEGGEWMADIEGCVIQAIAAGLIEARLDQRRQVVIITRSTQRQFQDDDWKQLGDKLANWRDHVQRMLMVIESAAAREL
jgi:translation initiation factor 3 subunit M